MAAFLREGFQDLSRRLRLAWLWFAAFRLRRALLKAEAELGWLGWERVDFFDDETRAAAEKIREYENAQASLLNTSAELSGRKAALDAELAAEKQAHDDAQAALARERAPIAAQVDETDARRRQRIEAAARFERAVAEIATLEKELEARSRSFMAIERPSIAVRSQARQTSEELTRLHHERTLVLGDKASALEEAAKLEPTLAGLRAELERIDAAAAAARDRLADATRRLAAAMRALERERKKSGLHMSRLDREKQSPYRIIGACLADNGIAPMNQPEALEKVLALRARQSGLARTVAGLRSAASAGPALLVFYSLLAALLIILAAISAHLLR